MSGEGEEEPDLEPDCIELGKCDESRWLRDLVSTLTSDRRRRLKNRDHAGGLMWAVTKLDKLVEENKRLDEENRQLKAEIDALKAMPRLGRMLRNLDDKSRFLALPYDDRLRSSEFGAVYSIRLDQFAKIGFTGKRGSGRFEDLACGSPYDLVEEARLYLPKPVLREAEALLHDMFRESHHRGEWFKVTTAEVVAAMEVIAGKLGGRLKTIDGAQNLLSPLGTEEKTQ